MRSSTITLTLITSLTVGIGCAEPDECDCFDNFRYSCGEVPECGTYISYRDIEVSNSPCRGDGADSEACANEMASNAAVVECVLAAAANEEPVSFRHEIDPTDVFSYTRDYWLPSDGMMYVSVGDYEDLSIIESTQTREVPALASCTDWACIQGAVEGASELRQCRSEQRSGGGL